MTSRVQASLAVLVARLVRITLAAALVLGLLSVRLALPGDAFACSCAPPNLGAPIFSGDEEAVFVGTAGRPQPDGTFRFAVERWFKGGPAREIDVTSEKIVFADGGTAINTCGLHFEVGDRMIMAASVDDGAYVPDTCSPHAAVASDEGRRLLEAAVATFGEGRPPGQDPTAMPDDPDLAGFAIGMVGILVLIVVIAVVVAARRRRDEPVA